MRIVFMGSPQLACPVFEMLALQYPGEVAGVVCQPDRPKGRHLKLATCAVKDRARAMGVPVLTPLKANAPETVEAIRDLRPDLIVVAAYGQILRPALLEMPALGCLNVHMSLLPRYRGAAPIPWAIARGETVTGVTTMRMELGLDTGGIYLQADLPIRMEDTAGTLEPRLAELGAGLTRETIEGLAAGRLTARPQDDRLATYAPKLSKGDGRIDWTLTATDIANRIRGFNPWPCGYCLAPSRGRDADSALLRILMARVEEGKGQPGALLDVSGAGPLVATGGGAVRLLEVQPAGKRKMSGAAYVCGHRLSVGGRFD